MRRVKDEKLTDLARHVETLRAEGKLSGNLDLETVGPLLWELVRYRIRERNIGIQQVLRDYLSSGDGQ